MNKPIQKVEPVQTATPPPSQSLVVAFATRYGVDERKLLNTLKATAFKQPKPKDGGAPVEITDEQMMALLVVANEYHLNPFTKEIYAFPAKGGGIVPIIAIDGWVRIVNERPELESIAFGYSPEEDEPATDILDSTAYVECTIKRRDRSEPVTIREYLRECWRDTDPWRSHPRRMLRHKALIQCARVAFGYGGIYDPDEAERVANAMAINVTASNSGRGRKPATREPQAKQLPAPEVETEPDLHKAQSDVCNEIDKTGYPESEVLAHFERGALDELTLKECVQAMTLIKQSNAAP